LLAVIAEDDVWDGPAIQEPTSSQAFPPLSETSTYRYGDDNTSPGSNSVPNIRQFHPDDGSSVSTADLEQSYSHLRSFTPTRSHRSSLITGAYPTDVRTLYSTSSITTRQAAQTSQTNIGGRESIDFRSPTRSGDNASSVNSVPVYKGSFYASGFSTPKRSIISYSSANGPGWRKRAHASTSFTSLKLREKLSQLLSWLAFLHDAVSLCPRYDKLADLLHFPVSNKAQTRFRSLTDSLRCFLPCFSQWPFTFGISNVKSAFLLHSPWLRENKQFGAILRGITALVKVLMLLLKAVRLEDMSLGAQRDQSRALCRRLVRLHFHA